MAHNDAVDYLKNYECVCSYGTSPTNCKDHKCSFYVAVNSLEYKESKNEETDN